MNIFFNVETLTYYCSCQRAGTWWLALQWQWPVPWTWLKTADTKLAGRQVLAEALRNGAFPVGIMEVIEDIFHIASWDARSFCVSEFKSNPFTPRAIRKSVFKASTSFSSWSMPAKELAEPTGRHRAEKMEATGPSFVVTLVWFWSHVLYPNEVKWRKNEKQTWPCSSSNEPSVL